MSLPEGNTPFPKSWHRQYASVAWVEHMVQNARRYTAYGTWPEETSLPVSLQRLALWGLRETSLDRKPQIFGSS